MKTAAVLIIAIVAQAAGNVLLTRGMKAVAATASSDGSGLMDTISQSLHAALAAARSPEVLAGTVLLIVFFALYSAALSWADLSFVLPATAFGYVLNVAAGHYFLDEKVTSARWIGSLIITLGVVCVSRSGERTTSVHEPSAAGEGQ
jgi:drug/metabolite transporter (DMT)-like permease